MPETVIGQEWEEWLDAFPVGKQRLKQGFDLWREHAVGELHVEGAVVQAIVRDVVPAEVTLQFGQVPEPQWELLWSLITPEAMREFRKGGVGPVVRNAFAVAEVNLLPERYKELRAQCSCGEWLKPCKHSLAVLRSLGGEIEADPMLLARLRGGGPREEEAPRVVPPEVAEPLRVDKESYWGKVEDWSAMREKLLGGGVPTRLLKRLGPVTVYGMRIDPDSMFKPVYEGVAAEAKTMIESIRRKVKAG
jgi:uncharacterized Zn finger protein